MNPSVLIPRPETELVVEAALELARLNFSSSETLNIADVGTGSGCIAVALASELPQATIYALDQSATALETAKKNAVRHGVDARIRFCTSLPHCSSGEILPSLEMVVSNPPYLSERDVRNVQREVLEFEPRDAVFAGDTGTEVYDKLITQAALAMRDGGFLVLELGYDSEEWMRNRLGTPEWTSIQWRPDLAGITRVVSANALGVKTWRRHLARFDILISFRTLGIIILPSFSLATILTTGGRVRIDVLPRISRLDNGNDDSQSKAGKHRDRATIRRRP